MLAGVKILTTIADAQAQPHAKRRVLVPTMGALHKAHGELIRVAREAAGKDGEVAVSIFVNPLQFEPGSDYKRYPRPEKADEEFCRSAGVDLLFRPSADEVYRKRSLDIRGRDFVVEHAGRQIAPRTLPRGVHSGREVVQHSRA